MQPTLALSAIVYWVNGMEFSCGAAGKLISVTVAGVTLKSASETLDIYSLV